MEDWAHRRIKEIIILICYSNTMYFAILRKDASFLFRFRLLEIHVFEQKGVLEFTLIVTTVGRTSDFQFKIIEIFLQIFDENDSSEVLT